MIRRVLVTAFEPWGEHPFNSSEVAVGPLDGQSVRGAEVKVLRLPVDYDQAGPLLEGQLRSFRPDALISFGMLSRGPDVFRVELIAHNVEEAGSVDDETTVVTGASWQRPVVQGGPPFLSTGLPAARIVRKLGEAGLAAEFSEDAGRFLCNHVFYRELHLAAAGKAPPLSGFVHVPPPSAGGPEGPGNREVLEDGAWIVVEAVIGPDER